MRIFPKVTGRVERRSGLVLVATYVDGELFHERVFTEEELYNSPMAEDLLDLFPGMLKASNLIALLHLIWLKIRTGQGEVEA